MMDGMGVLSGAASIVSFVIVVWQIRKTDKHWVLPALFVLFVSVMGNFYFWGEIKAERSLSNGAARMAKTLPLSDRLKFKDSGEHCGIVLAVMVLFEEHKTVLPEAYNVAAGRQKSACGEIPVTQGITEQLQQHKKTSHAASTMIEMVHQLAGSVEQ
ncbi:MAG: hypothetical protein HQ494_10545 [Rhodospirillales bacterium]|nr:hypothetical protein [Rhodospirillales bacterium]